MDATNISVNIRQNANPKEGDNPYTQTAEIRKPIMLAIMKEPFKGANLIIITSITQSVILFKYFSMIKVLHQ